MEVPVAVKASFDVSQALAKRELGEDHGEELIASRHRSAGTRHGIKADAAIELLAMDRVGNL